MGTPRKKPIKSRKPPPPPTPKSPKPWDPLPIPTEGDADPKGTFEAVGRAISSWELVEAHLGLIFSVFVDTEYVIAGAMRAYGSVISNSGRLEMIKAASVPHFLLYPDAALKSQVDDLLEAVKQFATRRNEIAHGIVQPYFVGNQDWGWALVPSFFATKKRMVAPGETEDDPLTSKPSYAYTAAQVLHWMEQFRELAKQSLTTYYTLAESRTAGKARRHAKSLARHLKASAPTAPETPERNPEPQPK